MRLMTDERIRQRGSLEALDALQVNDSGPFSTPADWTVGERVIVAPTSRPHRPQA